MLAVTVIAGILFVWAVLSHRLARWSVTAPIAMMAAGIAMTGGSDPPLRFEFDTAGFEHAVEVVLALLLFVDATEVPGGVIRRERGIVARLLGGALPLTLCLAFLTAYAFFPEQPGWVLAVLATVVVPLDLAPTAAVVRDRRIPARLRDVLNVEGGLNDGIVSPVFLLCLAAAVESRTRSADYTEALLNAVASAGWAVAVGSVVGYVAGWLLRRSWASGWTQHAATRLGVLTVPVAAYTLSSALGGNGFVASFVAGVCIAPAMRHLPADAVRMTDDLVALMSLALWFVFGQIVNEVFWDGFHLSVILYALVSVALVRAIPVLLVLTGTGLPPRDKLFLGWLGPRGVTSIVFGLLAAVELPAHSAEFIARVMVMTVMLSILLHGLSAEPIGRAYARLPGVRTDDPARPGT
ncbi:cation:proton antiporter [Streptomyces chryseus]|uniref:cation:proton antiporter n=1 Tax=Streptomyces chryseus TaxID=68186 RepID=UPI00110F9AEF|nr:cation:proton antiporter [Streptomyces chryseus]GGX26108.1 sodium/hydrogen exchanger [Streptomyces chryseus]